MFHSIIEDCDFLFEVEIKAYLDDYILVENQLQQLGAVFEKTIPQSDTYFQHPIRNFAQTDEALRIRISDTKSYLTYKGAKIDSSTKTREELELVIPEPDKLNAILKKLGFSPVMNVRKSRRIYNLDDIKISIDQVEELGTFIELELEISDKEKIHLAKERLFNLLMQLNISRKRLERSSYLELIIFKKLQGNSKGFNFG